MNSNTPNEIALVFHHYRLLKQAALFNYGLGEINPKSASIDVEQARDSTYKLLYHLRRLKNNLKAGKK